MSGSQLAYHLRVNKHIDRQLFIEALALVNRFRSLTGYGYVSMGGAYLEDCRVLHHAHKISRMYSFDSGAEVLQRQAVNRPYGFITCVQRKSREAVEGFEGIRSEIGGAETNVIVWLDYTNPAQRKDQLKDLEILIPLLIAGDIVRITLNAHRTTLGENQVFNHELESATPEQIQSGQFPPTLAAWRLRRLKEQLGDDLPPERDDPTQLETEAGLYCTLLRAVKRVAVRAFQPRPELLAFPLLSTAYSDQHGMVTSTFIVLQQKEEQPFMAACRWNDWEHKPGAEWDQFIAINVPHLSIRERHVIHALALGGGGFGARKPDFLTEPEFIQYSMHYLRYPTFAPMDIV